MVIIFAAGNDGNDASRDGITDPAQIGAHAAAKNCITVGASENDRPDLELTYKSFGFRVQPIMNDRLSNNPAGMAAFSSRGPTKENRIKPDVVAPGSIILSAHSYKAPSNTTFGVYPDPEWFYEAGTSMAAPLVAGCVAVIRETLIAHDVPKPTAALIKALLINGAKDLPGQYIPSETGPSPNNSSGFGLVDLANSIILPGSQDNAGFLEGRPLTQGEEETFTINIPDEIQGARDLKITLVWSDPPGANLQNDLDLIVIAANGVERHGNMGASSGFDKANNVEQISWARSHPDQPRLSFVHSVSPNLHNRLQSRGNLTRRLIERCLFTDFEQLNLLYFYFQSYERSTAQSFQAELASDQLLGVFAG
jgi:serine protease AprX